MGQSFRSVREAPRWAVARPRRKAAEKETGFAAGDDTPTPFEGHGKARKKAGGWPGRRPDAEDGARRARSTLGRTRPSKSDPMRGGDALDLTGTPSTAGGRQALLGTVRGARHAPTIVEYPASASGGLTDASDETREGYGWVERSAAGPAKGKVGGNVSVLITTRGTRGTQDPDARPRGSCPR